MERLLMINYIVAVLFIVFYSYQFIYIIIALPDKPSQTENPTIFHRFAVLISARNEDKVLPALLLSIQQQNYPTELLDTFVVADNCSDATAKVARKGGAVVWERHNTQRIGKGFALEYLFHKIQKKFTYKKYDGFLILDADNLLDQNYIAEMNKSFSGGYRILTSYRNSKNYDSNWISAGYSLWFMREARFLNRARQRIKTSCAVSGTGFLIHRDIIERNGGWKHFLLTEDIEFTIDSILQGETIGICETAVLYDEQPVSFKQSCRQRLRWAKGYLQVFRKYGPELMRTLLRKGNFSCFDMLMSTMPAVVLTVLSILLNLGMLIYGLLTQSLYFEAQLLSCVESLLGIYVVLFFMGLLTTITQWKMIHARTYKKIIYLFSFPVFVLSYLPISFAALFLKVEWKPIDHSITRTLDDVRQASGASSEFSTKARFPRVG